MGTEHRLRVVPLKLSPSCVTRKTKTAEKMAARTPGGEELLLCAPHPLLGLISSGHVFLAVFFRITGDRLSKRRTTRSLYWVLDRVCYWI